MPSQTKEVTIEQVIEDRPLFHECADGKAISWAVNANVLRFLAEHVKPGMATLETGSGHSTVAFAIAGAHHIAVTPSENEPKKIMEYCTGLGLEPNVRFLTERSDIALPWSKVVPEELDFVFIDGAHAFPIPCIDFHYTEHRLKVGGFMGVDDIFMPSVRMLYDFLLAEEDWELVYEIHGTAFFRLLRRPASIPNDRWANQGINKAFWERKLKRENSRWRWAIRMPIRILKNPRYYLGRLKKNHPSA